MDVLSADNKSLKHSGIFGKQCYIYKAKPVFGDNLTNRIIDRQIQQF